MGAKSSDLLSSGRLCVLISQRCPTGEASSSPPALPPIWHVPWILLGLLNWGCYGPLGIHDRVCCGIGCLRPGFGVPPFLVLYNCWGPRWHGMSSCTVWGREGIKKLKGVDTPSSSFPFTTSTQEAAFWTGLWSGSKLNLSSFAFPDSLWLLETDVWEFAMRWTCWAHAIREEESRWLPLVGFCILWMQLGYFLVQAILGCNSIQITALIMHWFMHSVAQSGGCGMKSGRSLPSLMKSSSFYMHLPDLPLSINRWRAEVRRDEGLFQWSNLSVG